MVRRIKLLRTIVLAFLAGTPIQDADGVRLTCDGLPVCLGPTVINSLRKLESREIPALLTILFSSRALRLGRNADTNPIEAPCTNPLLSGAIDRWASPERVSRFWKAIGYGPMPCKVLPSRQAWRNWHFTTKSGPNGHAQGSWCTDLISLPESLIDSLKTLGGKRFSAALTLQKDNLGLIPGSDSITAGRIRRIVSFPDREEKVRVIAVLDYFSQSVLKPLHSYLFRVLKKIPQDCTFDQGSFRDKTSSWTVFYSVDQTAATDRFPIDLIGRVLEGRLPREYVAAWKDTMVGYPFDHDGRLIAYAVGNPMGAYSSWASFAVAHHFIFFTLCEELGIDWKSAPYVLLGDDVQIGDHTLGRAYMDLILELGISYSKEKTYVSDRFAEFAKRILFNGEEVTPIPISALEESSRRIFLMTGFLKELRNKGWESMLSVPGLVGTFYENVLTFRRRQIPAVMIRSRDCDIMIDIMRGILPASALVNQFARRSGLPELSDQVAENILSNVIVELFAASNPLNAKSKGKPLGDLAINLVMHFTGQIEDQPVAQDLIHNHPLLKAYGLIEDMYMDQTRTAIRIDRTGEGWPQLMKAIAIPLDDSVFTERTSQTIMRASDRIAVSLSQRMEVLKQYPGLLG